MMPRSISLSVALSLGSILILAGGAGADSATFASQVPGIEAVSLAELPTGAAKPGNPENEYCVKSKAKLSTPAGQVVAAKNWLVTTEIELSEFTFVSFVERAERGTSGSCLLSDGNVGVFLGRKLLGVVFAGDGTKLSIGTIQELEGDRLRIWSGGYIGEPLADLQVVDGDLFLLRNVAQRDSFCEGQASVPNIYGLRIHEARRVLFSEGWRAAPNLADEASKIRQNVPDSFSELYTCSGTGFGFCRFRYVRNGSEALGVVTAGEDEYRVVSFAARCGEMSDQLKLD